MQSSDILIPCLAQYIQKIALVEMEKLALMDKETVAQVFEDQIPFQFCKDNIHIPYQMVYSGENFAKNSFPQLISLHWNIQWVLTLQALLPNHHKSRAGFAGP
jgi:hypothetical protein